MDETKTCPECYGACTVQDTAMSLSLGLALGMGYFPSTKTCPTCNGSGRVAA